MKLEIEGNSDDVLQALPEIILAIKFNQTKGETNNVKWNVI